MINFLKQFSRFGIEEEFSSNYYRKPRENCQPLIPIHWSVAFFLLSLNIFFAWYYAFWYFCFVALTTHTLKQFRSKNKLTWKQKSIGIAIFQMFYLLNKRFQISMYLSNIMISIRKNIFFLFCFPLSLFVYKLVKTIRVN